MVVKDGKIYYSLREIAPSSPYSADYLRIRILQSKLQGTKFGREWYTAQEWLAEYISRYGAKVPRAVAPPSTPVRYTAERQFIPLTAAEAPLVVPEPEPFVRPADSIGSPQADSTSSPQADAVPAAVDIVPPLQKTIYDFPAVRVPVVQPAAPFAAPFDELFTPLPKLAITRHPAYRELTAKLRFGVAPKLVAIPLTAAVFSLFLSVVVAGGISPARVLEFAQGAVERAGSFALETSIPSPSEIAAEVQGALERVPHRLVLAAAGIAALPERLATAVGDFLLIVAMPSPARLAAWPDNAVAVLEALPPFGGPPRLAAGILDSLRNFIAGLPRPKLPERIARFFNLSSPALTPPQANAPARYALESRGTDQGAGITGTTTPDLRPAVPDPRARTSEIARVREVIERTEVVRPADVSSFQSKLDELNAGLRTQVSKLITDVANLYTATDRKATIITSFAPSQSINELQELKVDSGLTVRSGNLTLSSGGITLSGSNGSLSTGGDLTVSGSGTVSGTLSISGSATSSLAYGFTAATSGGSIGFGTTSPSQFFAVSGNTYLTGGLGLGTVTTSPGGLQTTGMAVIGSNLDVRGGATSTFAGPLVVTGALSVNAGVLTISSTSTVTTQLAITRGAVTPHTFASWATGVANSAVTDSALLLNPASAVSDSNLFGIAIAGSPRFLIDAEGDIYGRNLILEGGTTQATTTLSGNLLVEGNAALGDAANADTHIIRGATILYASTTQAGLTIWNSSNGDLLSLLSGTGQTPTTRFTFSSGGNLGIGTSSPGAGFSVHATSTILGGPTTIYGPLVIPYLQATSTTASYFTGSLGIASTSPGATLSINGPFLAQGTSTILGGGLNTQALQATGTLAFYTSGTAAPRMVVDSSGNVGIATSGPATTLSVIGSGYLTSGLGVGYATTGAGNIVASDFILSRGRLGVNATGSPAVEFGVTGSGYLTGGLGIGEATTSSGGLLVKGQGVFAQTIDVRGAGTSTFTGGLSTAGLASSAGLRVSSGDTILAGGLAVTGSSNFTGAVGIGTSTPSHALTVRGPFLVNGTSTIEGAGLIAQSLFSTTSLAFYTNSNVAPRLTIDSAGQVGIASTSPGATLSINGPFLTQGTSTIYGGLNLQALQATGTLAFYTSGTAAPRMVIDASGNVGIATSGPATTFSTVGSGYFTAGLGAGYATTGAGNIVANDFLLSRGRLGVNATGSPSVEFGVIGSGYLTGGLGIGEATSSSGGLLVKGLGVFDQTLLLRGTGTSTASGGFSSVGLASSAGITSSAGDFLLTGGKIISTGTGTSTFSGGLQSTYLALTGTAATSTASNGFNLSGGCFAVAGACVGGGAASGWTPSGTNVVLTTITDFVGIGTATPGAKLSVGGSFLAQGTSTIYGGLNLQALQATGTLAFYTSGTDAPRMVIDSSGNVGIGTTSPGFLLGLVGSAGVDPEIRIQSAVNIPTIGVQIARGTIASPTANVSGDEALRLTGKGFDGSRYHSMARIGFALDGTPGQTGNDMPGRITFSTTPDSSATLSERMRITEAGNVGIGDASPAALLTVGSGDLFQVNASGNVGIGTTTPTATYSTPGGNVTVALALQDGALLIRQGGNSANGIVIDAGGTPANFSLQVEANGLHFYDNGLGGAGDRQMNVLNDSAAQNDDGFAAAIAIDYAEFMPKLDPNEEILIYEVIGVKGNKITKNTDGATQMMITSTDAGIRSGDPIYEDGTLSPHEDPNFLAVAFIGQMPVLVEGPVKEGDYIIPSGNHDGKARAISPGTITREQFNQLIGKALESDANPVYETGWIYRPEPNPEDSEVYREVMKMRQRRGSHRIINTIVGTHMGWPKLDVSSQTLTDPTNAWSVDQQSGKVNVNFYGSLNLNGNDIINVRSILSANGTWSIGEDGKLVAEDITARQRLQVGSAESPRGITLFDFDTGDPNCVFMQAGILRSVQGECTFTSSAEAAPAGASTPPLADTAEITAPAPPEETTISASDSTATTSESPPAASELPPAEEIPPTTTTEPALEPAPAPAVTTSTSEPGQEPAVSSSE